MRTLAAWIGARQVGAFAEEHEAEGTRYTFDYAPAAAEGDLVSLTMVPTEATRRFQMRTFPPPFDMILPEGERRQRIESARKILPTDAFSLLSYVGGNPVNRVKFLPPGQSPTADVPQLPAPAEIASCRNGLEMFQRLIADLDLRQGIAGVQPKVLGQTHILKASSGRYPFLAANEYACAEVFSAAGLEVPEAQLSADGQLLMVRRFDILADGSLLGFEEAAALMGETAESKYRRDYGSMIDAMARFSPPAVEDEIRARLIKAVVLNCLIGNGDAHLKNFGVLYSTPMDVRLTPFYDSVSTLPYLPDDVPALALSYDHYSKAWWPREELERFARDHGRLRDPVIAELFESACEAVVQGTRVLKKMGSAIPGFADLATHMTHIWNERVGSFRKAPGGGRPSGATRRRRPASRA